MAVVTIYYLKGVGVHGRCDHYEPAEEHDAAGQPGGHAQAASSPRVLYCTHAQSARE